MEELRTPRLFVMNEESARNLKTPIVGVPPESTESTESSSKVFGLFGLFVGRWGIGE